MNGTIYLVPSNCHFVKDLLCNSIAKYFDKGPVWIQSIFLSEKGRKAGLQKRFSKEI